MTSRPVALALLAAAALAATPATPAPAADEPAYRAEVARFQADREARLRAEDGWLSVAGLHWLKPGPNRIGGDPAADVALRAGAPPTVGVLDLAPDGSAIFRPAPGVAVTRGGQPFAGGAIRSDADGGTADVLAVGDFRLILLRRDGRSALRVKDNQAPTRTQFAGTRWFPIDPSWRVAARFTPHPIPKSITFETIIGGSDTLPCPGTVSFERDGRTFTLDAAQEPDGKLWFVFRDATAGTTTPANARQLTADAPIGDLVDLDFNRAINLPCAYIDYATCPVAPPQNRLPIPIPAGEMKPGPRPN